MPFPSRVAFSVVWTETGNLACANRTGAQSRGWRRRRGVKPGDETPRGLRLIGLGGPARVVDLGRFGRRALGVPWSGAFDLESHRMANACVNNGQEAATLELAGAGGIYVAEGPPGGHLRLGWAGAFWSAWIDNIPLAFGPPMAFDLPVGSLLKLGGPARGRAGQARLYLAVAGGWTTPTQLGSRSREEPLCLHELIPCGPQPAPQYRLSWNLDPTSSWTTPRNDPPTTLRLLNGPDLADEVGVVTWPICRVSPRSDRVGVRLEPLEPFHPPGWDPHRLTLRRSTPMIPGALQWTGTEFLALGPASGTTGGYPHLGQIAVVDHPRLAQLAPGDLVRFQPLGLDHARRLDQLQRAAWARRDLLTRVATGLARA